MRRCGWLVITAIVALVQLAQGAVAPAAAETSTSNKKTPKLQFPKISEKDLAIVDRSLKKHGNFGTQGSSSQGLEHDRHDHYRHDHYVGIEDKGATLALSAKAVRARRW